MKFEREYGNPDKFARKDLTFPQLDMSMFDSDELIGYHSYLNWFLPELALGKSLKLSLLFFDKVIAEVDCDELPEMLLNGFVAEGKLSRKASHKLLNLIVPIRYVVPKFSYSDLFRSPEDFFLLYTTEHFLDNEYISKGLTPPSEENGGWIRDFRYRVTVSAFENWFALSRQIACIFIPNDYEDGILRAFLKFLSSVNERDIGSDYPRFRCVITRLLPAIDELSIDEVLSLRNHEYFASFREKARQLANRVSSANNAAEVNRMIDEEERNDIKTLQDLFRPKPLRTVFRSIIGNIPLPTLVNPVALYDAAAAVKREFKVKREVGWLYLIRDLNEKY